MVRRQLQDTFDALLVDVAVPDPFDIELFCDRLALARQRPVVLAPFSANQPGMPCGLWFGLPTADLIFYEQATTPVHRDHLVLHEIGHMLQNHTGQREVLVPFLTRFLPAGLVDAERLSEAFGLRRASYLTQQEREAEAFARHIGARIRRRHRARTPVAPDLAEAFTRVLDALGPAK